MNYFERLKLTAKAGMVLGLLVGTATAEARIGAEKAWTSYEAEAMKGNCEVTGPVYAPHTIGTESSHQRYVTLKKKGSHVEFSATVDANAMVIRYSVPDAPEGGGLETELDVMVNGKVVRSVTLSSRNSWLYGVYPFSNDPKQGKSRNFYDEFRLKDLRINQGDVVRLKKSKSDGIDCVIDLVDLEEVPDPIAAPAGSLSILDFGAKGDGVADDTDALLECLKAARKAKVSVYVPEGSYKLTKDIVLRSGSRIQGAGMWYTNFVGDVDLYDRAERRVRFKMAGSHIRLSDFSIVGALNYRNDQEANDGIIGAGCSDSVVSRIWIEHTKVGVWIYNGANLLIEGCRFRNMLADGVNFCVGTTGSVVDNCSSRGTGDDCYAIWPAAFDQGYVDENVVPGNNVIRRSTGQLTFLANGASVYGGANNRVEDCEFIDIGTGCGILISTTFPTSDEERGIDNNFSGTTVVRNNRLVRCGGYDHSWAWRGAIQLCLDRKEISGLAISDIVIEDSISDGVTVVAPGSAKGQGTLSETYFDSVAVDGVGLGAPESHDLFIRADAMGSMLLIDCEFDSVANESDSFSLESL